MTASNRSGITAHSCSDRRPSLLYDADCGFCRWSVAALLRWDYPQRLRPVAIQSDEGQSLLAGRAPEERLASWHLVAPEGTVVSAGAALGPLFRLLPGGAPLGRAAERFPRAFSAGYRFVASRRSFFGRLVRDAGTAKANARIRERAMQGRR